MVEDYEAEEKKNLTSDFNEAKFQILRLHNSWQLCNSYRRTGQLEKLKWELDNIWDELSKKSEIKKGTGDFDKMEKIDKEIVKKRKNQSEFYNSLREKYRFLKGVQEDVGMGGRMSESDADSMDD